MTTNRPDTSQSEGTVSRASAPFVAVAGVVVGVLVPIVVAVVAFVVERATGLLGVNARPVGLTLLASGIGSVITAVWLLSVLRRTAVSQAFSGLRIERRMAAWGSAVLPLTALILGIALATVPAPSPGQAARGETNATGTTGDKTSPTPSGSLPPPSSTPQALTDLAALPDGYVGTWRGSAHLTSPTGGDFAVIITFQAGPVGSVVGELDRPSIGCSASLTLDKATSQSIKLTEQRGGPYSSGCTLNGALIASAGSQIVASLNGASLDLKEYFNGASNNPATAAATLSKGQ